MKRLAQFLLLVVGICLLPAWSAAEETKPDVSWSFDPATGVYTNNQTGISFSKSIAGFDQKRATPSNEDGSASFAYVDKRGLISLSLAHRLIRGYAGTDDCTDEFRESSLETMEEIHGDTDLEERFTFTFAYKDRAITGRGVTVHFVSAPQLGGPVYSEFGVVLVGDFLYSYRATFRDKAGLKDLAAFLKALGFAGRKKEASVPEDALP